MDSNRWNQRREARMQRRRAGRSPASSAFVGLIIIGVGVLFLLQNLGIVYVQEVWQFWPVILIAIGISKFAENRAPVPAMVLIILGGVFLAKNLGFLYGNFWQYLWPLFIIGGGVLLLLRAMGVAPCGRPLPDSSPSAAFTPPASENLVNIHIAFSAVERRISSQDFAGGEIHVAFGGVELDLRSAQTKQTEIFLDCHAAFGGIELFVPNTWTVVVNGHAAFGVFEDKTHPINSGILDKSPRLILTGGAAFGGVTVKN